MNLIRRYGELDVVDSRWWGVAWFNYTAAQGVVCMPIPLNKLAGLARMLWLWSRRPVGCKTLTEAYEQGRVAGRSEEYWNRYDVAHHAYRKGRDHELAIMEAQILSGWWRHDA